jgi:sorting nexin-41/42
MWAEPLHEYSQFASIIKKLLVYRHQKHVQYEMTQDAIETKKEQLEDLEKSEREARRLESALNRRSLNQESVLTGEISDGDGKDGGDVDERERQPDDREQQAYASSHSSSPRRRGGGLGLLNALSYSLHGMMDVDPETARRNSITKTRESLSQARNVSRYCESLADLFGLNLAGRCPACLGSGSEICQFNHSSRP